MPKRALTDAAVKRLKPPAKGQVEYFDRGYPGLALRLSYGGAKSFVYLYRVGGKLRRMTLGLYPAISLAEAREAWRGARQDAQAGRDPAKVRKTGKGATDFKGVFEEWLKRDQSDNKSWPLTKRTIERDALPAWEGRQIADIARRDVLDTLDEVVDRGAPMTARRLHSHLHRLFKWSVGRGIIAANPMADLPKPGSENKRERVLTNEEIVKVWKAASELRWQYGRVIHLLILTGARRGEIAYLRRSEIEGDTIKLPGVRTKSGEPHDIPLSTPARAMIDSLPRSDNALVFNRDGKPLIGWSRTKQRLDKLSGVSGWTIHDLRRTVATGLQKLRTPLQVTEAVLGHVSGSRGGIVGVYQRHDYADEKRGALEAWGAHVTALVEGQMTGVVLPNVVTSTIDWGF
jgi:integrase